MNPENVILKLVRSELHFRGGFHDYAFDLLGASSRFYKALIGHLREFGCKPQSIAVEPSANLANAQIVISLPDFYVTIRVLVDRLEIDYLRLHALTPDIVGRILRATRTAVSEADGSVEIGSFVAEMAAITEPEGLDYGDVLARYVIKPVGLGAVDAGVSFSARPVPPGGLWANLIIDRVFARDDQLWLKVAMGSSANEVPQDVAEFIDTMVATTLANAGLQIKV